MLLLLFVNKMQGKDKTRLHCSQGGRYSMEQNLNYYITARVNVGCSLTSIMGAIRWGTRGRRPLHFSDSGDIIWHASPTFFSLGFVIQGVHKVSLQFKKIIKKWNDEISQWGFFYVIQYFIKFLLTLKFIVSDKIS